jgi:hypothetical protein
MVKKEVMKKGHEQVSDVVVLTEEQKEVLARVCREKTLLYRAKCSDYK